MHHLPHLPHWDAQQWSAFGTVGGLLVAVVVATFAWVQVLQAKKVREERTRPYVVLDFEFQNIFINLKVRNIGATPARDVTFRFEPALRVPSPVHDDRDFDLFTRPIPMMAPGREISVAFGTTPEFFAEPRPDVPFHYEVHAEYTDLDGKGGTYKDPALHLDLSSYENTLVPPDRMENIDYHLRDIERHIKSWTAQRGIRVHAMDARKEELRSRRQLQRKRDRRLYASDGLRAVLKARWRRWKLRHGMRV